MNNSKLHLINQGCAVVLMGLSCMLTACSSTPSSKPLLISSFEHREKQTGEPASLVEALNPDLFESRQEGNARLPAAKGLESCRAEPVFLNYPMQTMYKKLEKDLEDQGISVVRDKQYVHVDIPVLPSAKSRAETFKSQLNALVEAVRDQDQVNLYVSEIDGSLRELEVDGKSLSARTLAEQLIKQGISGARIGILAPEDKVGDEAELVHIQLCYHE